ncbi:MAG: hypothetical protein AMS22_09815 [Thiotrichales bacterium SG8_50]|nr:MAG: hypothetical protein AMS22_09815 [Thiotrichales bacterium SG8_50]
MVVESSTITPRRFRVAFPGDVPKYWANGSPFLTAILNTYTLLVPDNELYYMRTLKKAMGRIEDPALKQDVLAFVRQEGEHGMAHRRYWDNLRAQGYRIDGFVKAVGFMLYRVIEPALPHRLHLAIVAAIEHFNATLGHLFLKKDVLRDSDPRMKLMMTWHLAEEIEHKSVSVDALRAAGIGEFLRIFTMLLVWPLLCVTFALGTFYLLAQDGELFRWRSLRDMWRHLVVRDGMLWGTFVLMGRYCVPGFHPGQIEDYDLAAAVFHGEFAARERLPQEGND